MGFAPVQLTMVIKSPMCAYNYGCTADVLHYTCHMPDGSKFERTVHRFYKNLANNPRIHPDSVEEIKRTLERARNAVKAGNASVDSLELYADLWDIGMRRCRMKCGIIPSSSGIVGSIYDIEDAE